MSFSKLKLNCEKTELILWDSECQRDSLNAYFPVSILDNPISPTIVISNLGVLFKSDFAVTGHVLICL